MPEQEPLNWQFLVYPTDPPSTSICVRPGWLYLGLHWLSAGMSFWYEPPRCDFSNATLFRPLLASKPPVFTGPNQYLGGILALHPPREEYAFDFLQRGLRSSPEEAEADILGLFDGVTRVYFEAMPLWAVVLRSGPDGALMAVDKVNRGRSYLWRDLRPRHDWTMDHST